MRDVTSNKIKKKVALLFNCIGVIFFILWLLTFFTKLEINNSLIKNLIIIWSFNTLAFGTVKLLSLNLTLPRIRVLSMISIGFALFYILSFSRSKWKTQTVIYQHKQLFNKSIEFQLRDKGARGYSRRTIKRTKILPFIDWIEDTSRIDSSKWKRVDIHLNEQAFKGG